MGLSAPLTATRRPLLGLEVALVLGVSLGKSAVYSILRFVEVATRGVPLNATTTSMNSSVVPDRPWLDLAYQLAGIAFPLVAVALAIYLLGSTRHQPARFLGLDGSRPWSDLVRAFGLAAAIGIPGLALYLAARAWGVNTSIAAANLTEQWWTVPVLVGAALMNGLLEEVVVLGYLMTRLEDMGWAVWAVVAASAGLRATYHLYQGLGGFVGNLAMGLIFALLFLRWRRVLPLVAAHTLLDVVAFVGYSLLHDKVDWL